MRMIEMENECMIFTKTVIIKHYVLFSKFTMFFLEPP
jgi:hypothetical protein